jgi:hypothetical protein
VVSCCDDAGVYRSVSVLTDATSNWCRLLAMYWQSIALTCRSPEQGLLLGFPFAWGNTQGSSLAWT